LAGDQARHSGKNCGQPDGAATTSRTDEVPLFPGKLFLTVSMTGTVKGTDDVWRSGLERRMTMVLHTTLVTSIHTGLEELDYRHLLAYANASRSNYAINKLQVVSTHGIFGGSLIVGFAKDETREGYLEFGFNWLDPVQGGAPVPRSVTFDVNLKKKSAPQITIKSDDSNRSWLTTDVLNFAIEVILSSFDDVHNRFAHRFTPRREVRTSRSHGLEVYRVIVNGTVLNEYLSRELANAKARKYVQAWNHETLIR
jgi:hypothetical protein